MKNRAVDMTNKRYGTVTALRVSGKCGSGDLAWLFRCDCGNEFSASGYEFRSGKRDCCPVCAAGRSRAASVKHGMSESDEFRIWTGMHTRCYNERAKAYPNYGGRGITICDRWKFSFENFYSDMGPRPSKKHSIDRIDNDGNYEPSNCRWATAAQQVMNRRNTIAPELRIINAIPKPQKNSWVSHLADQAGITYGGMWCRVKKHDSNLTRPSKALGCITWNGITDTYAGWYGRTGIKESTIAMRLCSYGWSKERALTKGAKQCA